MVHTGILEKRIVIGMILGLGLFTMQGGKTEAAFNEEVGTGKPVLTVSGQTVTNGAGIETGGSTQTIYAGGTASSGIVTGSNGVSYGTLINEGGTTNNITIIEYGYAVQNAGTADYTTIVDGAWQTLNGGSANHTTINMGTQTVNNTATVTNTTINYVINYTPSGSYRYAGKQILNNDATATGTILNGWMGNLDGGAFPTQEVHNNAQVLNSTINNAANQNLYDNAVANNTIINGTSTASNNFGQWLNGHSIAHNTTINGHGAQRVEENSKSYDVTLNDSSWLYSHGNGHVENVKIYTTGLGGNIMYENSSAENVDIYNPGGQFCLYNDSTANNVTTHANGTYVLVQNNNGTISNLTMNGGTTNFNNREGATIILLVILSLMLAW